MKHRHAKVRIYKKSAKYPFYRIAYRAEGRRVVRSFKTYGEAHREAKRVVRQIAKGNEAAAALATRDALAYKFALNKLAQLCVDLNTRKTDPNEPDIALPLEEAMTEFAEAKRAFGPARLIEAVKGYLATVAQVRRISVRHAADEYLGERELLTVPREPGQRPQLSPKLAYQDRLRLDRFAENFKTDVCDLTKEHLDLFFREHLRGLSPKSRNHYRATLRHWLKFCVTRDYLPTNHRLAEAGQLKNETTDSGDIEIYTAKEFAALLAHAQGPLQVLVALGGLAGLRTQELLRLEWGDLWRRPGFIEVTRSKAKTRQRRLVPIIPALNAWLSPWRQFTEGLIWTGRELAFHQQVRETAEQANVERKGNALRHSFISYRLTETQNENQVAQEAGTSPAMIHRNYRELCTPEEAKAWFAVRPSEAAGNAVPHPQQTSA